VALEGIGAATHRIGFPKPRQNGYRESFHARLRDECLNFEESWSVEYGRVVLERWPREYNSEHMYSSFGYAIPAELTAASHGR